MNNNRKILIFENSYKATNYLIKKWFEIADSAINEKGIFNVALSGGKTPVEFYCKLSGIKNFYSWSKTHIFQTDERFVPYEDPASNFRMIQRNLIHYINMPNENLHPIDTNQDNVSLSAYSYEEIIKKHFSLKKGEYPIFDLMLLGIGSDGHTASLFPGQEEDDNSDKISVPIVSSESRRPRISLTFPVINNARNIVFLVLGENKSKIIKNIIENKGEFPASKIKPKDGELCFILDKGSSRNIQIQESYTHLEEGISINI